MNILSGISRALGATSSKGIVSTWAEERVIRDEIDKHRDRIEVLRAKLPPPPKHEVPKPLDALVTKIFTDGAVYERPVDLSIDWKGIGQGIKDAIRQGAEVTLRPLFPDERADVRKEYPSAKRIRELEVLVSRVARLNPDAGEIGAGMLVQLVAEARSLMAGKVGA